MLPLAAANPLLPLLAGPTSLAGRLPEFSLSGTALAAGSRPEFSLSGTALAAGSRPESSLSGTALAAGRLPDPKQIGKVAQDFEGVFMSFLLKEMRQTLDEPLFPGDTSDVYGSMFDLFLGQHLATAGGLGVGDVVRSYLQTRVKDEAASREKVSQP